MSRIGLVNLVPPRDAANYLGFNHGLGAISAVLKRDGHETALFTLASPEEDASPLVAFRPAAIFVYLATNQFRLFCHQLETVWRPLGIPVVAGGPHPTALPEATARLRGVSGVCVGEGEETARRVAERVARGEPLEEIPNLVTVDRQGDVIWGPQGDFVEDLDRLPFPDRELFPYREMLSGRAAHLMGLEILCTRGCIYGCRYCINPLLRKVHNGGVRRRSVTNVITEIKDIRTRYGFEGVIGFHDDIFTLDTEWLARFGERYTREVALPFWCNAHIAELTEGIVKDLRRAGCFRVHVGIECGDEGTRRNLLNKHISNQEILEKIALLKRHHMKIVTTFMIGLPGEEEADIRKSIDLCSAIGPDWVLLSTFCPYPGTRLYRDLVSDGRLSPEFYKDLPAESFYSPTLTYPQGAIAKERLEYYFKHFRRLAGVRG